MKCNNSTEQDSKKKEIYNIASNIIAKMEE